MKDKFLYIIKIKNKAREIRGFTLVELITAMALLAIVSVMLFSICTGAINLIYRNNGKLNTLSGAKTSINNSLGGYSGVPSTTEGVTVEIQFGASTPVAVPGERIKIESTDIKDGSIKSDMYAFIPD
jgi:prepilin-type N-terminal cleavage/methylation domain-containing protein